MSSKHIVTVAEQFIKNSRLPACVDCFYHLQSRTMKRNGQLKMANCMKYGEKNIYSGKINYELVEFVRIDTKKCGPTGLHFMYKRATTDEKQ